MKKDRLKIARCIFAFIFYFISIFILFGTDHLTECAYIFLITSVILWIYENLESFNIFGIAVNLKKAKEELYQEAKSLIWQQTIRSIVLDCNGEIKNKIYSFLTSDDFIGNKLEITQTDDYGLNELARNQFISYKELSKKSVNAVGTKSFYEITLNKPVPIQHN